MAKKKEKNKANPVRRAVSDGAAGIMAIPGQVEKLTDHMADALEFDSKTNDGTPFWSSGARSLIKLGGKPLAVCQDFRWTVSYVATPIYTIDTPHAWDIDVGQVNIQASLSRIIDPIRGPEADGLFSIMSAAVHQPLVELQVLDPLGTCLFFARGMFTSVSGNVAKGQLGTMSAQFVGVAYQHYVSQQFEPYGSANTAGNVLSKGKALVSKFSGGLL